MTSLLHLPLVLVPGLAFAVIALLLRAPISRPRLAFSALAVCAAVSAVQAGLVFSLLAPGAVGRWPGRALEVGASCGIDWVAYWQLAKMPPRRAFLGALAATGLDWFVQFGWSVALGGRVARPG